MVSGVTTSPFRLPPQLYSQVAPQITPFDLLLFKGVDFISKSIQIAQLMATGHDEFTHCGLVVTAEILPSISQLKPGRLYVWESTTPLPETSSGIVSPKDITTGKSKFGVQLRDLEDVLRAYDSSPGSIVAWAPLIKNPWRIGENENPADCVLRRVELIKTMKNLYRKHHDRLYELNCLEFLAAVCPCLRPFRDDLAEISIDGVKDPNHTVFTNKTAEKIDKHREFSELFVFCSEFVCIVYQNIGVINKSFKACEVIPVDYLGDDREGIPCVISSITQMIPDRRFAVLGTPSRDHIFEPQSDSSDQSNSSYQSDGMVSGSSDQSSADESPTYDSTHNPLKLLTQSQLMVEVEEDGIVSPNGTNGVREEMALEVAEVMS